MERAERFKNLSPAKRALMLKALREEASRNEKQSIIPRRGQQIQVELSFAQQRVWLLEQIAAGNAFYNEPVGIQLQGELDTERLSRAINEIVRRHEILRTNYVVKQGQPFQHIRAEWQIELPIIDFSALSVAERQSEIRRSMELAAQRPFDLTCEPVLCAALLKLSSNEHILQLTFHHIAYDGWSFAVFIHELKTLYLAFSTEQPSPLKELPIQYADYAHWQRQWLQGEVLERQLSYWKRQLRQSSVLQLPTDKPRPPVQTFRGARRSIALSEQLSQEIIALSKREDCTLFMTLLAAFQILLFRYSGQTDISVGSPIANRNRAELEAMIGYFANTLVLHTDLSGNPSFRLLLQRVRETALSAFSHQDLPFERIVEALRPERNMSHSPLFQVMFILQTIGASLSQPVENLSFAHLPIERKVARFDLVLTIVNNGTILAAGLEYNIDLFEEATINRMLSHLVNLLTAITTNPDQSIKSLPMLSAVEQREILIDWNQTARAYPRQTVVELFEAQVAVNPQAIAIVSETAELSYQALNAQANKIAHYLQSRSVAVEQIVGICLERGWQMVAAMLGVLKAGAAYLPLDPAYPQQRLSYMLEDAGVKMLITQPELIKVLPEHKAEVVTISAEWFEQDQLKTDNPTILLDNLDRLAYVIYTSGSTGAPKGVMVQHSGIANMVKAQTEIFQVDAGSRVLQFASFSFDASVSEIFMALLTGAKLYLYNEAERLLPGPGLVNTLTEQAITTVTLPPSVLSILPTAEFPALKTLITAGEACKAEVMTRWSQLNLFNAYGPTEGTVCATIGLYPGNNSLPDIGNGIANTEIYILDEEGEPLPIGVAGEIYIGSVGLARGYINRADLTAEKFVPDRFSGRIGGRLYRTGDLARWRADGRIEFLGRIDNQIKIRGFRVEPGEIETVLMQHPGVQEAVVIAREDTPGNKRLVAYLVANLAIDWLDNSKSEDGQIVREVVDCRRGFLRVPINSAGIIIVGDRAIEVQIDNISLNGLRLSNLPQDWPKDPIVELKLNLPAVAQPLATSAKIVWRKEDKLGLQFCLPPSELTEVRECCNYVIQTEGLSITHLRAYLKDHLPEYLIPTTFVLIDSLPLSPNGKIDRRALPAPSRLRVEADNSFIAPRDSIELQLAQIWGRLLDIQPIGIKDNFFDLGGHSLLIMRLLSQIEQSFGQTLSLASIFHNNTIESLANLLRKQQQVSKGFSTLVKLQPNGSGRPFFWVHPIGGGVGCYLNLARQLGSERPFYGLQALGLENDHVPLNDFSEMAAHYLKEIRSVQPQGPYLLGGWSVGGVIVFEIAEQLSQRGESVELLVMLDTRVPNNRLATLNDVDVLLSFIRDLGRQARSKLSISREELQKLSLDDRLQLVLKQAQEHKLIPINTEFAQIYSLYQVYKANAQALAKYQPALSANQLLLMRAKEENADLTYGWSQYCQHPVMLEIVPGDHYSMLTAPNVQIVAERLKQYLKREELHTLVAVSEKVGI